MKSDVGLTSTLLVLGAQPQIGTGTVLSDSGGRDQSPDYGSCYKQAITPPMNLGLHQGISLLGCECNDSNARRFFNN